MISYKANILKTTIFVKKKFKKIHNMYSINSSSGGHGFESWLKVGQINFF